ncbi:hypothetical protein [Azospirillum picis]|uniref:Uncharacterized protein n=1 Tax=Azospirillum picis TaxID=488438 RepID=A0ABU0MH96_9PROT|nr:hypothetical protein [Azospirillum picis]MBP2298928.1 hypothetical protein [Azospirillum picis]MDQ0532830.1 hypothetical protein [Azospirillum picis]
MKVDPEVLDCATSLLRMARQTEREHGWNDGDLLRTTLRLLVVAGADDHGWSADALTAEVRDLVDAVRTNGEGGSRPRLH